MAEDQPDNIMLVLLRRLDERTERMAADLGNLKVRMSGLEGDVGHLRIAVAEVNSRLDRIERRVDRIERRLDIVEA
jgi:hypothetical protein